MFSDDPDKIILGKATMRHTITTGIVILGTVVLSACGIGAVTTNHGHLMSTQEIQQIQPGMGKEQVRVALGTPDTTSTIGGGAYYYISSKNQTGPFMSPSGFCSKYNNMHHHRHCNSRYSRVKRLRHWRCDDQSWPLDEHPGNPADPARHG